MAIVRKTLRQRSSETPAHAPNALEGRVIMGVDPGTNILGYGVLRIERGAPRCLVLGVVRLGKYGDRYQKLRHIFERITSLIEQYAPDEVALEAPFFGENVQSMLKLGRAQGVAMAAALVRGLPVFEYTPSRVKQSVTGHGGASKEQVAALLEKVVGVDTGGYELDATDGLAVALCHYYIASSPVQSEGAGGSWASFVNRNPGKVEK